MANDSDLQLRDAAGIVQVRGEALDFAYVEHWVRELALEDLWTRVKGARP